MAKSTLQGIFQLKKDTRNGKKHLANVAGEVVGGIYLTADQFKALNGAPETRFTVTITAVKS